MHSYLVDTQTVDCVPENEQPSIRTQKTEQIAVSRATHLVFLPERQPHTIASYSLTAHSEVPTLLPSFFIDGKNSVAKPKLQHYQRGISEYLSTIAPGTS